MYKNILLPVSFESGRDPQQALKVAETLRDEGGTITVLHVLEQIPRYASEMLPEDHVDTARKAAQTALEPFTKGIANAKLAIVEGHSARTILDYAEKHNTDCIVIASHRPGAQDLFLGSTASRVVRHATCAVHVIR